LAAKLRPGNVHSAEDWDELLLPEIERQQAEGKQVAFRADAASSHLHNDSKRTCAPPIVCRPADGGL